MGIRSNSPTLILLLLFFAAISYAQTDSTDTAPETAAYGPLIPATETMATAWDYPRNPMTDSLPANAHLAAQIKLGFKIFTNTPSEARSLSGNHVACNNCHLNGGQKEKAMALVGVATAFPEYNKRAGRLITLEDRIVECFLRSSNAAGKVSPISTHANEVLALSSYITWLSEGYPVGKSIAWRGENVIPADKQIPLEKLDKKRGETLYNEKCVTCHGKGGEGIEIGDKKAGPLWGSKSWNDGAGAARIYTLAGIIRYMMPYLDPGSLTDEEAQHISAYINSKPRPKYPYKDKDYVKEKIPPDAVYYNRK